MDSAAWAGLIGVAIGALLSGTIAYLTERRQERAHGQAVKRLVIQELVTNQARALRLLAVERWVANLPFDASIWTAHREALARALSDDEWMNISLAYFSIEAANSRRRDGTPFAGKDRSSLHEVFNSIESALEYSVETKFRSDLEEKRIALYGAIAASNIDHADEPFGRSVP